MIKKKGKAVSFDAMVKFFMQYYDLPTKADIDAALASGEQLEAKLAELLAAEGE